MPCAPPGDQPLALEDGILSKSVSLEQKTAALNIIRSVDPDRSGDVAVLWIDAHTDMSASKTYSRAHGYPARNVLGMGDAEFAAFATTPVPKERLAYIGIKPDQLRPEARAELDAWGAPIFDPDDAENLRKAYATLPIM